MKRFAMSTAASVSLGVAVCAGLAVGAEPRPAGVPATPVSLPEARRTVRMMNDIYVAGVLTTHKMYAHEVGSAAAIAWGKQVIKDVNARGWPKARIFTVADRPLNPENQAVDNFEREAGAAFGKGSGSIEKVTPGHYRYAVPIRVTERSCLNCHVRNKEGDLLGGVSYDALLSPSQRP